MVFRFLALFYRLDGNWKKYIQMKILRWKVFREALISCKIIFRMKVIFSLIRYANESNNFLFVRSIKSLEFKIIGFMMNEDQYF